MNLATYAERLNERITILERMMDVGSANYEARCFLASTYGRSARISDALTLYEALLRELFEY